MTTTQNYIFKATDLGDSLRRLTHTFSSSKKRGGRVQTLLQPLQPKNIVHRTTSKPKNPIASPIASIASGENLPKPQKTPLIGLSFRMQQVATDATPVAIEDYVQRGCQNNKIQRLQRMQCNFNNSARLEK